MNIEPISNLTDLEELDIHNTKVHDLTALSGLKKLYALRASKTPIADLTPLATLSELTTLILAHTSVSNLEAIQSLHKLERLDISQTRVVDLSPLLHLKSLRTLVIDEKTRGTASDTARQLEAERGLIIEQSR